MKKELTTTLKITRKELEEILREKLELPKEASFSFNLTTEGSNYRDEGYQVFSSLEITTRKVVEL